MITIISNIGLPALIHGFIYGFAALLLLFHLIIYFISRRKSLLYDTLVVSAVILFLVSLSLPVTINYITTIISVMVVYSRILPLVRNKEKWYKIRVVGYLLILIAFSLVILPPLGFSFHSLNILISSVTVTGLSIATFFNIVPIDEISSKPLKAEKTMAELVKTDKIRDEHLAITAHEMRTPISGMIGIAELLIDGAEGQLPEPVMNNLNLIAQSGRRLSYLLNDMLDVHRLRESNLELNLKSIHLRSVVNKVFAVCYSIASTKNLELKNDIPSDIPAILADEQKLEQILINFVGNALKFTESGYVRLTCDLSEGFAEITVEDTGKGISKDNLDEILADYDDNLTGTGNKRHQTGLGLKISARLLELHESTLYAESVPGAGSFFSFKLKTTSEVVVADPLFENFSIGRMRTQVYKAIKPPALSGYKKKYSVMVIDDELINLKVLGAQLARNNYEITECSGGEQALGIILNGNVPDLIILDVMMPGLSGFDVLKQIRDKFSATELPVIMLTAKNHSADILEAFQAGANDYTNKPIAKDELLARIKTHIELSKINTSFSRFVPHEFLQFLGYTSVIDIKLGDQVQKEMTVLFSDIKGFTRISENMTPKESFDFINTFLGIVCPIIRKHGGFIDKFIGDAIMALFPGHVETALNAAVEISTELQSLNKERILQGLEPISVGTGLHCGELMLGTIGEEQRMEGTVISDVVNTASRLEGLTSVFGVPIIISSDVIDKQQKDSNYQYKYLGKTKVKGKQVLINIYGVIDGKEDDMISLELKTKTSFEKGIHEFYKKNFTGASVHFNEVLKINPNDKAAEIFLKKSASLMISNVPDDWNGAEFDTLINPKF